MKIINIIYQFTVVLFQIWFLMIDESLRYLKILKNVERIDFDKVLNDKIDKLAKSTNLERGPLGGYITIFGAIPLFLIAMLMSFIFGVVGYLISTVALYWMARKLIKR